MAHSAIPIFTFPPVRTICDYGCKNQSFVTKEFCQTFICKCSLFINFALLIANEIYLHS